ncbi:TetR/AcrR family transcriptional regulator [bacterium]|nr:TetR/AcrR family transcriptional regulator [bacterium]
MRTTKRHSRQEQLLLVSGKVFAKKGYHATSISDICKKANIARGTLYLYFDNKRDIFDTLIKQYISDMLSAITKFHSDQPLKPQFNKNVRAFIEVIIKNKDLTRIVASEAVGLDSEFDNQLIHFYATLVNYIEGALLLLKKSEEIPKTINAQLLAYSIIGLLKEVSYQWALDHGNLVELDPLLQNIRQFKLDGFMQFSGE